jgi:hypothetical protein
MAEDTDERSTSRRRLRVPGEVSDGHNDIESPMWGQMMLQLMELNKVFHPDMKLRLEATSRPENDPPRS